jgi:hypothetical protein
MTLVPAGEFAGLPPGALTRAQASGHQIDVCFRTEGERFVPLDLLYVLGSRGESAAQPKWVGSAGRHHLQKRSCLATLYERGWRFGSVTSDGGTISACAWGRLEVTVRNIQLVWVDATDTRAAMPAAARSASSCWTWTF